jgi:hypothetical protein
MPSSSKLKESAEEPKVLKPLLKRKKNDLSSASQKRNGEYDINS